MPERETSSLQESVAAEIRGQLARRRLSGRQAALLLGWTSPYLSRRLTGEVAFDVADLEALAELLNVPVASFLQGPPAPVMMGVRTAPIRFRFDDDPDVEPVEILCSGCDNEQGHHCRGAIVWCECPCADWVNDGPVKIYRSLLGLAA